MRVIQQTLSSTAQELTQGLRVARDGHRSPNSESRLLPADCHTPSIHLPLIWGERPEGDRGGTMDFILRTWSSPKVFTGGCNLVCIRKRVIVEWSLQEERRGHETFSWYFKFA